MNVYSIRSSEARFVTLSTNAIRNPRLSLKAKGLLCYLLSHRHSFDLNEAFIIAGSLDGKHATRAAMKELEDEGYARRHQMRAEAGTFGKRLLIVTDDPSLLTDEGFKKICESIEQQHEMQTSTDGRFSDSGKTGSGLTGSGKSTTKEDQLESVTKESSHTTRTREALDLEELFALPTDAFILEVFSKFGRSLGIASAQSLAMRMTGAFQDSMQAKQYVFEKLGIWAAEGKGKLNDRQTVAYLMSQTDIERWVSERNQIAMRTAQEATGGVSLTPAPASTFESEETRQRQNLELDAYLSKGKGEASE